MLVYRFLSEHFALHALQTRELKVGRLGELNDPADCLPTILGAPRLPTVEAMAAFEQQYFSEIFDDMGIVSFSGTVSNPVVWSHYADAHRGIAVGYEFEDAKLFKVKYDDKRASLDFEATERIRREDHAGTKYFSNVITTGFTHKGASWAYEEEYRLFINLYHCTMSGPHYFLSGMTPDRVALGLKCKLTESDVRRMLRYGLRCGLARAQLDRATYSMVVPFK
jgi:Protein of unknown function (DUF2971)